LTKDASDISDLLAEVHCELGSLTRIGIPEEKELFFLPKMNKLLEKFNDLKKLNNYTFSYLLEDGSNITFKLSQYNYPHLLGLQKLEDIPIIGRFNDPNDKKIGAKIILSLIKKEVITYETIANSAYYPKILERFEFLSSESMLSLSFNEVIVDFDRSILTTLLKSDYLLIEKKDLGWLHLGLVISNGIYVPETFFFDDTGYYQRGQKVIKVKEITIRDAHGNIVLFEDKIN